uniref:2-hydroxyflavanone C-glucosyltransferase n=1 Tax=Fallopia multiflora TaxID=76025 RepID=A0A291PNG8_9CARY|nr:UDP-glycosyltransferase [Fallopia multiflora]
MGEMKVGIERIESMSENKTKRRRPHAVCIPYPAQGHIGPMLKLAKLLHSSPHNFHISFVNTHHNHRRLQRAHGSAAVSGLPSFRFHVIPDGLPPADNPDATQDIASLCISINETCPNALRDLLSELNSVAGAGDGPGPVSCVVADAGMWFAVDVAEEFGVPAVRFWTASACALLGYAQYESLVQKGVIPLPDSSCLTNGYLDKVVEGIPSMEGITLKHPPSFIRTTDANDFMLNYLRRCVQTVSESRCPLIFNTFEALEGPILQTLATAKITNTPDLTIGPLSFLLPKTNTENHSTIRSSLLPEDPSCLSWLDSKPPDSVIYVSFGSVATLTPHQVIEFACGLVNSEQNFLWVIRPDLVGTSELGSGAVARQLVGGAQGRGMLASWCDQEMVLAHPAVGGFLTHCGWNSTIEAIGNGVAVVCWPFFADQQTNSWFCCEKWGAGVEIGGGGEVRREEVERVARTVVDGDKGKEMRWKAREWKRLAEEASLSPNGSSYINFKKLVDHLLGSLN